MSALAEALVAAQADGGGKHMSAMTEERYLRICAIVSAYNAGMTWQWIGDRHGISRSRAHQIHKAYWWPTDVAAEQRQEWRERFGFGPEETSP